MFSFLPKSEKTSKEQKSWIAGSLLGLTLDKRLTSGKKTKLERQKTWRKSTRENTLNSKSYNVLFLLFFKEEGTLARK